MHELGLCEGVLDAVERRAQGRSVARVGVRVGEGLHVSTDAFQQSFQVLAHGGVAEGAVPDIAIVPGEELTLEWIEYAGAS